MNNLSANNEGERQTADAVSQTEESLAVVDALLGAAPIGFAFWDRNLRFLRINESLAAMDGVPETDHLGRPLLEVLPAFGPLLEPHLRHVMEADRPVVDVEMSVEARTNTGEKWHWQVSCYPVRTKNGQIIGVGAFVSDVSERKAAQNSLLDSEARMRAVLNTVIDGIITIDERGTVESLNPAAERIFGYQADEVIGQNVNMLMPEPYHSEHQSYLGNYLRTGKAKIIGIGREVVGRRKDGSTFPMDLAVGEVRFGEHRLFTGIVRNITERKRAEAMLAQQAQELADTVGELQQFAYVASHDLQEPLRMVSSYVQLLARRYQGQLDADADEFIGYAVDGAERMRQLINALLAYSRVGTRGNPLEPTDCEKTISDTLANLQVAIEESGAVVTHDRLPTVIADRTQLGQLFQNLIGNALKFHGREAPHVHVSAQDEGAEWIFSVRDNGIGIDPQFFDRIFLIFQRLHSRTEYPGTGVGLAICKKIVERQGGRIWVQSELGKGTTFYFSIPKRRVTP